MDLNTKNKEITRDNGVDDVTDRLQLPNKAPDCLSVDLFIRQELSTVNSFLPDLTEIS